MALKVKASDQGWFYHAPPRPKQKEPVIPPPPSQIPGLSDVSYLPPEPVKRTMIRESDSRYVRLAKQGGRPNLLRMLTPELPSSEPVGYPRCDWFYDNVDQPAKSSPTDNEPYQFMLPDYMVHQPYQTTGTVQMPSNGQSASNRPPYANDRSTVYEREGDKATDKTVKLTEERQPGYGVRNAKHQQRISSHSANSMASHTGHRAVPSFKAETDAHMKKILSYSYAADYDVQKQQWEEHQKCRQDELPKKLDTKSLQSCAGKKKHK